MTAKIHLAPLTPAQKHVAKRMSEKTGLPLAALESDLQHLLQDAQIKDAVSAKAKSLEHGDLNAYRAWMIREARYRAGLTQQQLARLLKTGQPTVARLENPKYEGQSLTTMAAVAKALKMRFQPPMILEDATAR